MRSTRARARRSASRSNDPSLPTGYPAGARFRSRLHPGGNPIPHPSHRTPPRSPESSPGCGTQSKTPLTAHASCRANRAERGRSTINSGKFKGAAPKKVELMPKPTIATDIAETNSSLFQEKSAARRPTPPSDSAIVHHDSPNHCLAFKKRTTTCRSTSSRPTSCRRTGGSYTRNAPPSASSMASKPALAPRPRHSPRRSGPGAGRRGPAAIRLCRETSPVRPRE